jgi:hypothetical protein
MEVAEVGASEFYRGGAIPGLRIARIHGTPASADHGFRLVVGEYIAGASIELGCGVRDRARCGFGGRRAEETWPARTTDQRARGCTCRERQAPNPRRRHAIRRSKHRRGREGISQVVVD